MVFDKEKITPEVLKELYQALHLSNTADLVRKHIANIAASQGYQIVDEMTDGQIMLMQENMDRRMIEMCEECFKPKKK